MRRRVLLSAAVGGLIGLLPGGRAFARPMGEIPITGERMIVYRRGKQRLSIYDADGSHIKSYFVSGHKSQPRPGRYRVWSKSPTAFSSRNPDLQWKYMIRFARSAKGNPIGFHQIPRKCKDGVCTAVQGPGQVGTALSAGCVRQRPKDAQWLYKWAELGTLVVVLA
jgi:lipoprotein-anchoring transpeptidase ErfK/SrfK